MNKCGVVLIDKPYGVTSRDVVNDVCRKLQTKKVGHCGTLDPLATGVLVICVGNATKLVPYLTSNNKVYSTTMILGRQTTTGDLDGEDVVNELVNITDEEIASVFETFPKTYIQEVPIYSAVKVNGKKLYEYARENIEVELPLRNVEIESLKLLNIDRTNDKIEVHFECEVSKGTYIRSLCNDLAVKMNTVSVMSSLVRIRQGCYSIDECSDVDGLSLININEVKFPQQAYNVTSEELIEVKFGRKIENHKSFDGEVILYSDGELLAIYESDGEFLKSKRGIKIWK